MGRFKKTALNSAGRVARKAAQVLRDRGWGKGSLVDAEDKLCYRGAIAVAMGQKAEEFGYSSAVDEVSTYFAEFLKENYPGDETLKKSYINPFTKEEEPFVVNRNELTDAMRWNDHVMDSAEEAIQWLEKFADRSDPQ